MLRYLIERPGRLVTKDELMNAVWDGVAVGDAALAVCVAEIRKALGDEARTPRYVQTVHRRGYRFVGAEPKREMPGCTTARPAEVVGRADELDRLRTWLAHVETGERRVVFVTGEAGIGKTTLVETFLGEISPIEYWVARGQCLDHYGAGEAYLPVLEALSRLARGPAGQRVVALLSRHAPTWLAQMPALVPEDDAAALYARTRGGTRERMLREMAEALEELAAERPLVLVLEDLHWSDHSTLDLVAGVAQRRERARLLVIGTYRPVDAIARDHPLRAVTHELEVHGACEELSLAPLGEAAVRRYLTARFGEAVAARLGPLIHHRTDGLPLFVIMFVEAIVGQRLLAESEGGWEVADAAVDVAAAVPDGLRQMIEQQLLRLPPEEQRLLEAASAVGMTFSAVALAAALETSIEAVEEQCAGLARRAQFIRASGQEDWLDGTVSARCRFLHVLYEQVLYDRIPPATRAGYHLRIAEREEAGFRARPGEHAAVLAMHFERGRDPVRSIQHRREAARQALERHASPEAVAHLTRALEVLDTVPDPAQRLRIELELRLTLGPGLIAFRGPGSSDVERLYVRARELAEQLGDQTLLYRALWGLWFVNYAHGRYGTARDMGERLLALAESGASAVPALEAHHTLWTTLAAMGETRATVAHLERGLALYDAGQQTEHALFYDGHDAGVCRWNHVALTQWLLGYPDRAVAAMDSARRLAETLAHPLTTVTAHNTAALIRCFRGELDEAHAEAGCSIALNTVQNWLHGNAVLACLELREGRPGVSIRGLCQQLTRVTSQGLTWRIVVCFCLLAEAACEAGDVEAGLDALARIPREQHGAFFASELSRIRGELVGLRGARAEAERSLREAMSLAEARGERSLELRAATSLARLLARDARIDEARKLLAGIYGWFTEGFDTADLRAARALLDELRRC